MLRSFLVYVFVLLMITFSGCSEFAGDDSVQPDSSSLVRSRNVSKLPEKPVTSSRPSEIVEPNGVVTLKQALDFALANNPQLKAFSLDVQASHAKRLQASLSPNPQLNVAMEDVGGSGQRSGFDSAETTVQLSQKIEMAQKRSKRTRLATLKKDLAQWDYQAKRLDVTRQVTGAFIDVLAAQERLALTKELVGVFEQAHNAVTQRVKAGKDSPVEQTKSAVELSTMRIELDQARRALVTANKQLAAAWGSTETAFGEVEGRFNEISPVPPGSELSDLVSNNPDMARWAVEKQMRRAALKLEKARAAPDITLSGGLRRFNESDDSAMVFGLAIPLPVSNRNQGSIRHAMYMYAKSEQNRRAAEVNIKAALTEAAQRLAGAFAEAAALEKDVLPGAQSAFDATGLGYREGKFGYLQVLDSQRTLFEVKGQYIKSLAAYHKAKADVERLIGQSIDSIKGNDENNQKEPKK